MTTLLAILRTAALASLALLAMPASAQYVWTDAQGHKQYSDMPPPSSVPRSHILKQPGGVTAPSASAASTETPPDADATVKSTAALSTADRNTEFQKRLTERAAQEKKAAEVARRTSEKAENCDKMQGYARALQDGVRISTTDKNGERDYMTDEQRAAELQKNQRAVRDCNR